MRKDISRFLYSTPVMGNENFMMLLSLFELVLNGVITPISDILTGGNAEGAQEVYIDTVDIVQPRTSGEYEENIRYLIRNGMVEELDKLHYENYQGVEGKLGPNQLRSLKNSLIILNSMCLRAAISGGLDTETAYTLGELYVKRIESAETLTELGKPSQLIKRDYCRRVKRLSAPKIDNLYVLKAAEYVQKHIYEKVTAGSWPQRRASRPSTFRRSFPSIWAALSPNTLRGRRCWRRKSFYALPINRFRRSPRS